MAVLGFAAGILYSFGGLIIDVLVSADWISTSETPGLSFGTVLAFGALIGMPAIGATLGFVLGIGEALVYPWFVRSFAGIEVDVE